MNIAIQQAHNLFQTAGFDYVICGGFALDMFAGKELRTHGDFDITIFKEDKHRAVQFMQANGWPVYGRFMEDGKILTQYLFYKIDDITNNEWNDCRNMWTIKPDCLPEMYKIDRLQGEVYSYKPCDWRVETLNFIELEIDIKDETDYIARDNPRVARSLDKAILYHESIPYLAPEIILFYKTDKFSSEHPQVRPKTEADFNAMIPLLSNESKDWLMTAIKTAYPDGFEWLSWLKM